MDPGLGWKTKTSCVTSRTLHVYQDYVGATVLRLKIHHRLAKKFWMFFSLHILHQPVQRRTQKRFICICIHLNRNDQLLLGYFKLKWKHRGRLLHNSVLHLFAESLSARREFSAFLFPSTKNTLSTHRPSSMIPLSLFPSLDLLNFPFCL